MSLSPTDAHAGGRRRHGTDQGGDPDVPVFLDSTGRRALLLRRAGIVVGAAFLVYGVMLGVAFMGGPSLAPSGLSPFDSVGSAQDAGTDRVRQDGSPSAKDSARPCRKQCRKNCRQRPGKPCGKGTFGRTADGPGRAVPTRSASSSAGGR
ncbi:hypothetical protein ACFPA8_11465 [Streptomyces ovatisporus]|uniref:Uncharacterized protein n=1 Tax=Streptomyces ovatisporus TaxID=1128682 RepID=A0ABV9A7L3_9ACTN